MFLSPDSRKAFTLIELLIVITIIGILAVALAPRISGGASRARDAQRRTDLQAYASALETYLADNGSYPPKQTGDCLSELADELYSLSSVPLDPAGRGSEDLCTTGYSYVPLNTDADSVIEGYLLVALTEEYAARGQQGVYRGNAGILSGLDRSLSAQTILSSSEILPSCHEDLGNCDDNTYQYVYVIGR